MVPKKSKEKKCDYYGESVITTKNSKHHLYLDFHAASDWAQAVVDHVAHLTDPPTDTNSRRQRFINPDHMKQNLKPVGTAKRTLVTPSSTIQKKHKSYQVVQIIEIDPLSPIHDTSSILAISSDTKVSIQPELQIWPSPLPIIQN